MFAAVGVLATLAGLWADIPVLWQDASAASEVARAYLLPGWLRDAIEKEPVSTVLLGIVLFVIIYRLLRGLMQSRPPIIGHD
jgi:hypothetical protein